MGHVVCSQLGTWRGEEHSRFSAAVRNELVVRPTRLLPPAGEAEGVSPSYDPAFRFLFILPSAVLSFVTDSELLSVWEVSLKLPTHGHCVGNANLSSLPEPF